MHNCMESFDLKPIKVNIGNSNYSEELVHDSISLKIYNHEDSITQVGFLTNKYYRL